MPVAGLFFTSGTPLEFAPPEAPNAAAQPHHMPVTA
jgi:hypothetical protein